MNKDFKQKEMLDIIKLNDINNENKVRFALFSIKTQSEKCELLINLVQSIPTTFWIELTLDCIGEMFDDNQKKLCEQIAAIFNENENFTKNDSIKLFKLIEEKAVSMGLYKTPLSLLIPKAASFFNKAINDNRYKLFADYGHVYFTSDIDELKTAVVELNERYVNGGSFEIVRCYAYLLTIAQFRLAHLLYPKRTIDNDTLLEAYEICFEQYCDCCGYDDLDSDWKPTNSNFYNSYPISSIPKRIQDLDCIEITRIFDPHLYYIGVELLREIHTAVREVSERNRYENETAPIVSKSCLFVINPSN